MQFKNIFSWFLMLLFVLLGVLNLIYIHPIPGLFYLVLSLFYCPPLVYWLAHRVSFVVPYYFKVIVAFLILWATLAVGDLVEYFETKLLY